MHCLFFMSKKPRVDQDPTDQMTVTFMEYDYFMSISNFEYMSKIPQRTCVDKISLRIK